jgi:phage terminase large subunit-like protein
VTWIKRNFYIPETKDDPVLRGRIGLQPYQEDVLREALSKDEKGNYKYSIIIWSDIKKSAKSTLAAAVNLARAWHTEYGEYYVIANDLKQADSRVANYLRRAIVLSPLLKKQARTVGYRTTLPNGTFIEAIPIDPSGEAGSNADQITFSELWGANENAKQHMWAEMTIPPTKYGRAFRWIESYAGFTEESKLLYSLYDLGVNKGRMLWPDKLYPVTDGQPTPLEVYVNESAGMLCLWNTQPRCPWQTKEYYASEEKILPPNEYLRVHRNQWVSSTENFVPMEWYDSCKRTHEQWPRIDQSKQAMIIALDAGITSDTFSLWMGCRHPEDPESVLKVFSQKWVPKNGKIDFQGTEDNPGPELVIRRLIKEYNVVWITYDQYQLYDMMQRLYKEGLGIIKPFGQEKLRLIADSQLRTLIRDRRYWHRGEPDDREHFQNADAKVSPDDNKIRIVKRVENLKVDLAVVASMGSYMVKYLNL